MAFCEMEHDRPGFEQREIAVLISRNLPEGMERAVGRFLHRRERNKADVIRLADLFQGPPNAHVSCQSAAAIRRTLKGGNGGRHSEILPLMNSGTRCDSAYC